MDGDNREPTELEVRHLISHGWKRVNAPGEPPRWAHDRDVKSTSEAWDLTQRWEDLSLDDDGPDERE